MSAQILTIGTRSAICSAIFSASSGVYSVGRPTPAYPGGLGPVPRRCSGLALGLALGFGLALAASALALAAALTDVRLMLLMEPPHVGLPLIGTWRSRTWRRRASPRTWFRIRCRGGDYLLQRV